MKPVNFDYMRPATVDAAIALLNETARSVKLIAGGQSLGPMLNMRLVQPDLLVDIAGLAELTTIEVGADAITFGACITHADIEDLRVPDVTKGALPSVARGIAYRAVRNRGTVGGSLTHADPSADWLSILSALGATVEIQGSSTRRSLPVETYVLGPLEANLEPGEMLVSVSVPRLGKSARWGYYKSCRKTGEFAHAIGAFLVDPERQVSRAVIGATEGRPIVAVDARPILGDGTVARPDRMFDKGAAAEMIKAGGITDTIRQQLHLTALKRAVERAYRDA